MQVLELPRQVHPYFLATQAHAELTSRPLAPSPMFTGLIQAALAYSQTGGTEGRSGPQPRQTIDGKCRVC